MSMYVTPRMYETMGFGIDLDGIEDFELAAILSRASAIADGYCAVPNIPRPHSFLGGEITTDSPERHPWRLPENDFDAGSRRIYPYHWPIKTVTRFRVYVTNTQYVEIAPSELFINNTERYVEVISLQFTGVGLFGAILPSLGLMRPVSEICYTYGDHIEEVGERLYPTDARTYRARNQFWINEVAERTKVYVDGAVQNSGYTVDWTEGTVVFTNPLVTDAVVTADYEHKLDGKFRDGVALIGTHLLGEREHQARGMTGVASLKVAEVTITNSDGGGRRLTAENLAYIEPEAAWLLDGFKFWTVR